MDGIILYNLDYESDTVHVIVMASDAPFVTVEKTVRHSIVPPEPAEKIPASTTETTAAAETAEAATATPTGLVTATTTQTQPKACETST